MERFPLDGTTILRRLVLPDAEELFDLTDRNRARLRRWLPWLDGTTTVGDSRRFIAADLARTDGGFQAGIWSDGRLVGVAGMHAVGRHDRATSLGYWLGAEGEGRGIMTLAVRALLAHAFGVLELRRVEIRCAVENHRSRAIPERLGFTLEGTLRQAENLYGTFGDLAVYGLLAHEWRPGDGRRL